MKKMNWTEVKKYLRHCSDRDLLSIIQELYQLNFDNQEYLHLKFIGGNHQAGKETLIEEMIEAIQKGWAKAKHDPYGYGESV